jgi:hypothetical protein
MAVVRTIREVHCDQYGGSRTPLPVRSNGVVFELKPNPSPMQTDLVADPFRQQDGTVNIPTGPGLGVEVNQEVVDRYLLR